MSTDNVKKGQHGDHVKSIQTRLGQLGFTLTADGVFGDATEHAVRELQTLFGYTVDGIVGPGTNGLIDAQIGYGWNYAAPDAKAKALASQGKHMEAMPAKVLSDKDIAAKASGAPPVKGAPPGQMPKK